MDDKIGFWISKISIKGFRGLADLSLDLEEDQPCILIGPNNSGKSTVLNALGLALSSLKFRQYTICQDDFWRNDSGEVASEIVIDVSLSPRQGRELPPVRGGLGSAVPVHGIRFKSNLEGCDKEYYLLDEKGSEILISKGTKLPKDQRDKYKGSKLSGKRYARPYDIIAWLPEVWHLEPENLYVSLYEWKSGPLGRLMKLYEKNLFTEKWKTENPERQMPDVLSGIYNFIDSTALKTPFWREKIAGPVQQRIKSYLGEDADLRLEPKLGPIESWLLSAFVLSVSPGRNQALVAMKRLGSGWQSILRLVALEVALALGDDGSVLLLVEEPESYLHPHLRRKFRAVLDVYQGKGHQVIATTHSAELVSFEGLQQICRLSLTSEGAKVNIFATEDAGDSLRIGEKLQERGNHESVFADRVVITEGKPDRYAVLIGLEMMGIDADAAAISVVDAGGVENEPDYASLCSNLGIPWFAIHDKDFDPDGTQKAKTKKSREKLDEVVGDRDCIAVWDNDLDDAVGYRGSNDGGKVSANWIRGQFEGKSWADVERLESVAKYRQVMVEIRNWCESGK